VKRNRLSSDKLGLPPSTAEAGPYPTSATFRCRIRVNTSSDGEGGVARAGSTKRYRRPQAGGGLARFRPVKAWPNPGRPGVGLGRERIAFRRAAVHRMTRLLSCAPAPTYRCRAQPATRQPGERPWAHKRAPVCREGAVRYTLRNENRERLRARRSGPDIGADGRRGRAKTSAM
jgi:hypothetical protein